VTGDVTGSELAKVCQQSHMSVMGHNRVGNMTGKMSEFRNQAGSWTRNSHRLYVEGGYEC